MSAVVSIIVPCYKQAEYLPDAVDSILAQTFSDWECIIVNDGSPDDTEKVAQSLCQKDERIKYIFQTNSGVSAARNNAIRHSSGKYILPLDADDKISPDFVQKAVEVFDSHPDTSIVLGRICRFGAVEGFGPEIVFSWKDFIWENQISNTAMYKRVDYDKAFGYNENMKRGLEDWDFYLSMLSPDSKVVCIDAVCYYRVHGVSRSSEAYSNREQLLKQIHENHPEIYKKYFFKLVIYEKIRKTKLFLFIKKLVKGR